MWMFRQEQGLLGRPRRHRSHEPVSIVDSASEDDTDATDNTNVNNINTHLNERQRQNDDNHEEDDDDDSNSILLEEGIRRSETLAGPTTLNTNNTNNNNNTTEQTQTTASASTSTPSISLDTVTDNITSETRNRLLSLTAERTLHRRRSSTCVLLLSLLLLYLYIQSFLNQDLGLFWTCLIFTTWLMRWVQRQREEEELLDRRMEDLWHEIHNRYDDDEEEEDSDDLSEGEESSRRRRRRRRRSGSSSRRTHNLMNNRWRRRRNRDNGTLLSSESMITNGDDDNEQELDYRMLSFQTQLAMAIMESQRHILVTGGYGRPDANDEEREGNGVSEDAKRRWKDFVYTSPADVGVDVDGGSADGDDRGGEKTSFLQVANKEKTNEEDLSCCICLSEYEHGDSLIKLGCGHIYHAHCINSWCEHSIRCPLCNLDLEEEEQGVNGAEDHSAGGGCLSENSNGVNNSGSGSSPAGNNGNGDRDEGPGSIV